MSQIIQKLDSEIKEAMKSKNAVRLSVLRMLKTSVKNKEIELIHPISETEFLAVVTSMVKQRKESIAQYKAGNRQDLVDKEEVELKEVESFLPKQMSESEVLALIEKTIVDVGAKGPKDMGLVMKALKDQTAGKVDGKFLSDKVKEAVGRLA